MAPKKQRKTSSPTKKKEKKSTKGGHKALKSAHTAIVNLDRQPAPPSAIEDELPSKKGRDIDAAALRAIKGKINASDLPRVLAMVLDGKKFIDYVKQALLDKPSAANRLGSGVWTNILRKFKIKANPVADMQKGVKSEWPESLVDSLADCQSDNHCTRSHGLKSLKTSLREQDDITDGGVWGLLNTIFTMDAGHAAFQSKMLNVVLSWFAKGGRTKKHAQLWKACEGYFDAALSEEFIEQASSGTSTKTFVMTHRWEVLAFLTEAELATMLSDQNHLKKHEVLASLWEDKAIVRALWKDQKRDVDYAHYRKKVIDLINGVIVDGELPLEKRQDVMDACKEMARELVGGGSFWWKSGIAAAIDYRGKACNVEFNDITMEYKLRVSAIEKPSLLHSGILPPFTWEDVLFTKKAAFDPEQIVDEAYSDYVACRMSIFENLKAISPLMHIRIDRMVRHGETFIDADQTWILDEAWLQQHGLSALEECWHATVLSVLPSQSQHIEYDKVHGDLVALRTSAICKLLKDELKEDVITISSHVGKMKLGQTADMDLKSASAFWKEVQARMHWFFRYRVIADKPAAGSIKMFAQKQLRGQSALNTAIGQLMIDTAASKPWDLSMIQEMKPWTFTFDAVQLRAVDEATKLTVAKKGLMVGCPTGHASNGVPASIAIEDHPDQKLIPIKASGHATASGSSSSSSVLAIGVPAAVTAPSPKKAKTSKSETSREALREKVLKSLQGK